MKLDLLYFLNHALGPYSLESGNIFLRLSSHSSIKGPADKIAEYSWWAVTSDFHFMDGFFPSLLTIAVAEIGDKTQLLSLFLTTKFKNAWAIIAGIFLATVLNHAVSAWLGSQVIEYFTIETGKWIIAVSFILVGLWYLVPSKDSRHTTQFDKYGAFTASTILFFLAETGDKTQVATTVLGAQYGNVMVVTIGTTIGMLIANVPVVYAGETLMQGFPVKYVRIAASILFVTLGLLSFNFIIP